MREYVTPVPKISQPDTEDDLRLISLTADLTKDYNKFLVAWMLTHIQDKMDPAQFGGMKGGSITHYLILFMNFILSNLDNPSKCPKSIVEAYVDFHKGFNKLNHNKILIRLSDWSVPPWLLKIVASYLTQRPRANPTPCQVEQSRDVSWASSCSSSKSLMSDWTPPHLSPSITILVTLQ